MQAGDFLEQLALDGRAVSPVVICHHDKTAGAAGDVLFEVDIKIVDFVQNGKSTRLTEEQTWQDNMFAAV